MAAIGYSTGAIALGDFSRALSILSSYSFDAVELSALRIGEVGPLVSAVPTLDLVKYRYVSFHAPSSFREDEERDLVSLLERLPERWPIVLHPDAIYKIELWRKLSTRLAVENMDRRKGIGRTPAELHRFFKGLPEARMCLDIGHARQVDSSMVSAYQMLNRFRERIIQLHVSEVDTFNRHSVISLAAELAFARVKRYVPPSVALIVESRVHEAEIQTEADKIARIFNTGSKERLTVGQLVYA